MAKLQDRVPALQTRDERLAIPTSKVPGLMQDGRFEKSDLVAAVKEEVAQLAINRTIIEDEAYTRVSETLVQMWATAKTIKLDRTQRLPVYQTAFGFRDSWFRVGSTFVAADSMTSQDFEVMLERLDRRIGNAETDRSILADFYARAKPGLDAGRSLVEQFELGELELAAADQGEIGSGAEEGEDNA